jgi:hypothetical protein
MMMWQDNIKINVRELGCGSKSCPMVGCGISILEITRYSLRQLVSIEIIGFD